MRSAASQVQELLIGSGASTQYSPSKSVGSASLLLVGAATCVFLIIATGIATALPALLARMMDVFGRQTIEGGVDPVGVAAVVFALLATGSRRPRIASGIAACGNACFLAYALRAQLPLVLVLRSLLLPFNILQSVRLASRRVEKNS